MTTAHNEDDSLELKTSWEWKPERFTVHVSSVDSGPDIPGDVHAELRRLAGGEVGADSPLWKAANQLIHQLAEGLSAPAPFKFAGEEITSEITRLNRAVSSVAEDGAFVVIMCEVVRSNGMSTEMNYKLRPPDFTELQRAQIEQLHRDVNRWARQNFDENYGGGEINPDRWKQEKTEVFISYRSTATGAAEHVFDGLGEYEDRTVFLPRLDRVDMQAGNWMDQLMEMIARCPVFVPVLSRDYLSGPIAKPELDQALRDHYHNTDKRVIPVLVEGTPDDYLDHFIGGLDMVQAQGGITQEVISEIAFRALGLSRNPYE